MRVCIVSLKIVPFYQTKQGGFGGAEVQAAFLADALSASGQDVTIAAADLAPEHELPHEVVNAYYSDAGIPGLRFFSPRATGVLRALARANADIYYQRNAGMVTGLVALYCRMKGKVFVYGAGSNTDFSMREVRIDGLRDRSLYYAGLKAAHGIVVQNEDQRELCSKRFKKPVRVIPNGIRPAETNHTGGRDTVVWIGALRRVKRPELFVELAKRLPNERFVMVGGAPPSEATYADKIADLAAPLPNLELTGRLPQKEVSAVLERATVLANTSSVEGFPNVYLEAWNHSVPIVTFNDVDGLIETKGLGALCTTVDDMESALRAIMADDAACRAMGERAKSLVEERFSPQRLAGQYVSFFDDLLRACSRGQNDIET